MQSNRTIGIVGRTLLVFRRRSPPRDRGSVEKGPPDFSFGGAYLRALEKRGSSFWEESCHNTADIPDEDDVQDPDLVWKDAEEVLEWA